MNCLTKLAYAGCMLLAAMALFAWPATARADDSRSALSGQIEKRLGALPQNPVMPDGGIAVYAPAVLQDIYRARDFRPAWIGGQGPLPQADALLNALSQAGQQGLDPEDYHLRVLTALVSQWRVSAENKLPFPVDGQIDLELLLTDALTAYGFHLLNGRVVPESVDPDRVSYPRKYHLPAVLAEVLDNGDIQAGLHRLTPQTPLYRGLIQALADHTAIAGSGGWPAIPSPRGLKNKADMKRYLSLLQERLVLTGDLTDPEPAISSDQDNRFRTAVRRYQKRHGLKADGVVGPATLMEMNVPVERRIEQIRLNLERLRRLPEKMGRRHILVNITDFTLAVFENDRPMLDMPIVVGKHDQRTFAFSARMTRLELNPYWNIPKEIAAKEVLPEIQKDPEYLARKNIRVIEYSRPQGVEIDPETIDWSGIDPDRLGYSFRQEPGPGNALGRIKFMFPNRFDIYLHDTPERHLFKRERRTFSHGCIRIARPIELAEYLLEPHSGWDRAKILAEIGKRKRQIVNLPDPVDVHIVYLTAWADPQGQVQFRRDIYDGDARLLEALNQRPQAIQPDDIRRPVKKEERGLPR